MRQTRVDDRRRVFDGFFKVDEATVAYEKPDGSWSEPSKRLSVERGDAAAVLVHDTERDVLTFVRQFRYPTLRHGEPWLLEIVAGMVDPGETAQEAARREVEEEIGVRVESLERIAEFYGSPGGMSEKVSVFYAQARYEGGGGGLEGEDLEVVEMPVVEALEGLENGDFHDGKTLVALLWLAGRRSKG